MDSQIFELYKQSSDIRNQIIQNFDNQVLHTRGLFGTLISAFFAAEIIYQKELFIIGIIALSLLFWIVEASVKQNQRGYILTSNEIQKLMSMAQSEEEIQDVIKKFHSDLNGFYSIHKENPKWYKNMTSILHTMFMPNVFILYACSIFVNLIVFCISLLYK